MHVTDRSAAYGSLAGLQSAASRLSSPQAQMSSGRQITSAQAGEGAAYRQVQNAQAVSSDGRTNLASQLSDIQDIDLADLAVQVTSANVTYQAALQTTANVRQLSLLNFLR